MKRNHELFLINLGLEALLERATATKKRGPYKKETPKKKKGAWSAARRKKFAETMAKKFPKK